MIYLHTGQPGAGKSLYTLFHVRKRAEAEQRPVFYNGIPELNIPEWTEFPDVEKWHELPPGAIIVIDECQRAFRPRGTGKQVPEYVAKFETHRHAGHDVYLVTQHPMLVDQNIRRLAGTHRHIVRTFGSKKAFIHEWNEVKTDCDRRRTDSSKTAFVYPKEVFGWYKSAEVHTHKLALPKQVFYLLGMLVVFSGLLWYLWSRFTAPAVEPEKITASSSAPEKHQVEPGTPAAPGRPADIPLTREQWAESYAPRVAGLPHTAPRYDELTKPTRVAVPAACVAMGSRCDCYTQDATKLPVGDEMCRRIVARGYFLDFDPEGEKAERERGEKRDERGSDRPALAASSSSPEV